MVTCIGYYSRQILPFRFVSGEGVLPYIGYIGMNTLKGYGFLEIMVRNRVSFWSVPWKGGPHSPAHFFFRE